MIGREGRKGPSCRQVCIRGGGGVGGMRVRTGGGMGVRIKELPCDQFSLLKRNGVVGRQLEERGKVEWEES